MPTVLIADDSEFMRDLLKEILERNNYQVIGQAKNGREAVELYKKSPPDFVTMDITMPEMNGIKAVQEIIRFDQQACIFVVSSMGQDAYITDAIQAGAKGFIVKPFKEAELLKTLQK